MSAQPPVSDPIAEIAASPPGPQIGAFFDLDGTLVDGFTATAHASDRIRRRQARIGEVLGVIEASMRYRLGRMRFEHLLTGPPAICGANPWPNLMNSVSGCSSNGCPRGCFPPCTRSCRRINGTATRVVLSSSALTIHAEPVARFLEINHVLCNHFELDEHGRLTGRITKPIVWGRNKATRGAAVLRSQ